MAASLAKIMKRTGSILAGLDRFHTIVEKVANEVGIFVRNRPSRT